VYTNQGEQTMKKFLWLLIIPANWLFFALMFGFNERADIHNPYHLLVLLWCVVSGAFAGIKLAKTSKPSVY